MAKTKHRRLKADVPLTELAARVNVTIEEAMRLTGFARERIVQLMDDSELRWFWVGTRRRVVTKSITEYQDRRSAADMGRTG